MKRTGGGGWQFAASVALASLSALLLSACSDQVDSNIQILIEGGDGAEDAKMALKLARKAAIDPLMAAFAQQGHSPKARAAMIEALGGLYVRERDKRILTILVNAVDDRDASVRRVAVGMLGDLNKPESAGPLVKRLGAEDAAVVRLEILIALGIMGTPEAGIRVLGRQMTTGKMTPEEKQLFVETLSRMREETLPDTLMSKTLDWLEAIAEEDVQKAQSLLITADVAGAEEALLAARELVPDSKNVGGKLAKFYYDNGEAEKGMQLMGEVGTLLRVARLSRAPVIDGIIDDDVWDEVAPLTEFYQNINRMRAYPSSGQSEAYVGHRQGHIYIAVKGYEPTTDNLRRKATERDQFRLWEDDCVEIFFDPGRSYQSYYQIIINNIGTVFDQYSDGTSQQGDTSWNAEFEHAVHTEAEYWSLEIGFPAAQFSKEQIEPGTVWGSNIARIRIANASDYGQWVPTYGSALRPDRFGFLLFE